MTDPRIGKGDKPPTLTISGNPIPDAADRVHLGNGYYARLDSPHAHNTIELIDALKAEISKPKPTFKTKAADDDTSETA